MTLILNDRSANRNIVFDRENIIFVEGRDDAYFVEALITSSLLPAEKYGIYFVGGKDKFGNAIKLMMKSDQAILGEIRKYVVVVDGDDTPETRFNFVMDQITEYETIKQASVENTVLVSDSNIVEQFGIYVLRSDNDGNNLDALVYSEFSQSAIGKCVDAFFQCTAFSGKSEYKRRAIAFLLMLSENEREIIRGCGYAFKRGLIDFSTPKLKFVADDLIKLA